MDDVAALDAAARDAGVIPGDPAYPFVQGMRRMLADQAQEMRAIEDRLGQVLDQAKAIAGGEIARSAARELPRSIDRLALQQHRRMVLAAVALLVAALLVGAGSGYWFRGAVPILVGVRAGAEKCEDRPDGSRLCWIPVYERLPATK